LLLSLYFQVSMSVEFNKWYGDFYNILQNVKSHTFDEFRQKLFVFTWIAIRYILLATFTSYATRRYALWWREAITFDYIPRWRNVREEIEGASQRIQEDAYRFAKIVESLGLQTTRAIMTLVAFLPILAVLSKGINLSFLHGAPIGHAMWFSVLVSIASMFLWRNFIKKEFLKKKELLAQGQPVDLCTPNRVMAIISTCGFLFIFWQLAKIINTTSFPEEINLSLNLAPVGNLIWFGALLSIFFIFLWKFIKKEFSSTEPLELSLANKFLTILTTCGFLLIFWYTGGIINADILSIPNLLLHIPISTATLVWLALYVSILGTWLSWLVGGKLPGLEYNNQKVEAAFRKELVYGEDDKTNYASMETVTELFTGIRFNYRRLFLHYGYFDLWLNLFGQVMTLLPFLIGGPALFAGTILLGTLIQIDNAFGKIQNSFAVFMDNWTTITELRSIKKRLREFEANLDKYQQPLNQDTAQN